MKSSSLFRLFAIGFFVLMPFKSLIGCCLDRETIGHFLCPFNSDACQDFVNEEHAIQANMVCWELIGTGATTGLMAGALLLAPHLGAPYSGPCIGLVVASSFTGGVTGLCCKEAPCLCVFCDCCIKCIKQRQERINENVADADDQPRPIRIALHPRIVVTQPIAIQGMQQDPHPTAPPMSEIVNEDENIEDL